MTLSGIVRKRAKSIFCNFKNDESSNPVPRVDCFSYEQRQVVKIFRYHYYITQMTELHLKSKRKEFLEAGESFETNENSI